MVVQCVFGLSTYARVDGSFRVQYASTAQQNLASLASRGALRMVPADEWPTAHFPAFEAV